MEERVSTPSKKSLNSAPLRLSVGGGGESQGQRNVRLMALVRYVERDGEEGGGGGRLVVSRLSIVNGGSG